MHRVADLEGLLVERVQCLDQHQRTPARAGIAPGRDRVRRCIHGRVDVEVWVGDTERRAVGRDLVADGGVVEGALNPLERLAEAAFVGGKSFCGSGFAVDAGRG